MSDKDINEGIYSDIYQNTPGSIQPGQVWNNNPNPYAPGAVAPIQQPTHSSLPPNSAWNNENPGWQQGKGIQLRCCHRLMDWQQMIVTKLKEHDQCILAKPAVGKTMPIICYWANTLLKLNVALNPNVQVNQQTIEMLLFNPGNLPQVLWLVPIRSLSENILQDVKEDFVQIILQIINQELRSGTSAGLIDPIKFTGFQPTIRRFVEASGDFNSKNIAISALDQINYYLNQVTGISDPLVRKEIYDKVVNLDISFFNSLSVIIKQHVENHFVGQKYENTNSWEDRGKAKPFVIAIYESAKSLINRMNNLQLMVFDECQRLLLSGVNNKMEDERAEQIMDSLDFVLASNNARNARLVLLSGTTHPDAAKELISFLNVTYHRTFEFTGPVIIPGANEGNIKILPMDGLDQFDKQVEIIRAKLAESGPRSGGVLYIILDKRRIDMLLAKFANSGGNYGSIPKRNLDVGGKKSYFDKQNVNSVLGPAAPSDITDPLLRKAVANGLGRIYRPHNDSLLPEEDRRDNQIVQQLFLRGEIPVLLTTESVREGINVKARVMYLSRIETGGEKISIGNLCQLINRVGRAPGYYTIYVATKDAPYVEQALNANPNDFSKESHIPDKSFTTNMRYNTNSLIRAFKKLIT
jgi:hypothetical protein